MPVATPSIKIDGVKKLGGVVKLHGNNYDEAQTEALRMVIDEGRSLIHPFGIFLKFFFSRECHKNVFPFR